MNIELSFSDDELFVTCQDVSSSWQYNYHLLCNENIVFSTGFVNQVNYKFTLTVPGYYRVKVAFRENVKSSEKFKFTSPCYFCPTQRSLDVIESKNNIESANKIVVDNWTFDFLYFPGADEKLFILLSSAIDREKQTLPVFNRWSWAGEGVFPGHAVCIADPTLERFDDLSLGWYLGGKDDSLIIELVKLINKIACTLNVSEENIVFWGSSVGGFSALRLSQYFKNCTAVAINTQVDINKYEIQRHVNSVKKLCLSENDQRANAENFYLADARVILAQNIYDLHHYHIHYKTLRKHLDEKGIKYRAIEFSDRRGHVGETTDIVNKILNVINSDVEIEIFLILEENKLKAEVLADNNDKSQTYYFYLLNRGAVVSRSATWQSSNVMCWELESDGVYSVQYHVKKNGKNRHFYSKPITYCSQSWHAKYLAELESVKFSSVKSPLALYKNSSHGNADWCIFTGTYDAINTPVGFKIKKYDGVNVVFSGICIETDSKDYFFAGHFFEDENLYYGADQVNPEVLKRLSNNIGQYNLLTVCKENKNFSVQNDFFGVRKAFYFSEAGFIAVSNRYHLMLLILSNANIKLTLNKERILAQFAFNSLQPFHQAIHHDMDVRGVKLLPVNKNIECVGADLILSNCRINDVIDEEFNISDDNYYQLLKIAKEEILNSIRAVAKNNKFREIIVDLSGGLDSRLVFAGVTCLPEIKDRIRINSYNVASEPQDLNVALSINNYYGYKYNDLGCFEDISDNYHYIFNDAESSNLGLYYSYTPLSVKNVVKNAVKLTGFYGEICARPYYSRKYRRVGELGSFDVREFATRYINSHRHLSFFGMTNEPLKYAERFFNESVAQMPDVSAFDKFDYHYLYFRNGLHFSDYLLSDYVCPTIGPIMSETLFRLKNNYTKVFDEIKVQFDIISILNPVIAKHYYNSEQDNIDYKLCKEIKPVIPEPSFLVNFEIKNIPDAHEWQKASNKSKERKTVNKEMAPQINHLKEAFKNKDNAAVGLVKERLLFLINDNVFDKETVGLDLWLNIEVETQQGNNLKNSFWYLFNKINSVFHQFCIIKKI